MGVGFRAARGWNERTVLRVVSDLGIAAPGDLASGRDDAEFGDVDLLRIKGGGIG